MPNANKKQIFIGIMVLLVGLLIYFADRPPDHIYLVYKIFKGASLHTIFPGLFGPIGNNLPAFIHVFSFSLITAGLLGCNKMKVCSVICLGWFVVDFAFELGQRWGSWVSIIIPDWFSGVPFLEASKTYFLFGTFDSYDLFAILLGSIAAYLTILGTIGKEKLSWTKTI